MLSAVFFKCLLTTPCTQHLSDVGGVYIFFFHDYIIQAVLRFMSSPTLDATDESKYGYSKSYAILGCIFYNVRELP